MELEQISDFFFFFFFFILRRMGKNKALAHHTSAYFHTRRVSIAILANGVEASTPLGAVTTGEKSVFFPGLSNF